MLIKDILKDIFCDMDSFAGQIESVDGPDLARGPPIENPGSTLTGQKYLNSNFNQDTIFVS